MKKNEYTDSGAGIKNRKTRQSSRLLLVQQAAKKRATSAIVIRPRHADQHDQGRRVKTFLALSTVGDNSNHTNKEATGLRLQAVPVASPLTVHPDTGETRV